MKRKLLVIGSGGREHAIGKKLLQSPLVETVYCLPGNAGMVIDGIQLVDGNESDQEFIASFCQEKEISWVFVGPEVPLIDGLVDFLETKGIKAFGPKKNAAIIEGSKDFAKRLMAKYDIPTANYETFTDRDDAIAYLSTQELPIVIKADGLAAGKGVVIAQTIEEATQAVDDNLLNNVFDSEEPKIVIEEFLVGKEFSLLSFVGDSFVYPMVAAKDHKAIFDGDKGPNTGGMGVYTPVPYVTDSVYQASLSKIVSPTVDAMKKEGRAFQGILYTGLILTKDGPKVIEYNARFGDPETQVLLERLETDLVEVIESILDNQSLEVSWKNTGFDLGVVVSAKGYPNSYEKGKPLNIDTTNKEVNLFFAGVAKKNDSLVSNGGRVFMAESSGATLEEARQKVYGWLSEQQLTDFYYRTDIGK
ncbi:phosphoribosylamine--glycine ligase [Melissococcus sp. OM08-11BH]|uniref:phosphoribosylamine--glycine ligase n=1 Tax=Melissococcus sp. OM08-11BH TaxID=2293110 RepID=UPI000E4FFE16|nr:phosphoribosylamine--glycine ligase [Melissococcus sp. OM08-11BH]RGI32307.1 phosphoribosylamine--glycine ligase [Melissococcus sp. OM08-11BH]